MGMVHTVGLVLHPRRDSSPAIETIINWANTREVTVLGLPDEVGRIDCSAVAVDVPELVERAALLVSLGGDGTMLRSMRLIAGRETPVLGVNLGPARLPRRDRRRGAARARSARSTSHQFTVEPRMAVRTTLPGGQDVLAFNDIALVREPGHGSAAVGISTLGHPFVRYAADAVIVATPTGSTAYSFSAGGPIVSPTVEGILVVPAAAHSSFNRALVLSADDALQLDLLPSGGRLAVEVDGGVAGWVEAGDSIVVTAVRAAAKVVRLGYTTFYERTRRKLRVNGSAEVDYEVDDELV